LATDTSYELISDQLATLQHLGTRLQRAGFTLRGAEPVEVNGLSINKIAR
jgi:hypothetical protein